MISACRLSYDAPMDQGGYDPDPWHDAPDPRVPTPHETPADAASHFAPVPPSAGPTQHQNIPPAKSTVSRVRAALAWCVILGCTLVLVALQYWGMQDLHEQHEANPKPSFTAIYIARYAVGAHQLAEGQARAMLEQFDTTIEDSPHPQSNLLRSAILAGEIGTPEDVAQRLNQRAVSATASTPHRDAALIQRIYNDGYTPTRDERAGLVERHGWLGKLAATHNLAQSNPDRQAIRSSGIRLVVIVMGLFFGKIAATLIGLGILITLIILLVRRSQRLACPTGPASHPTAYLETVALFLALFIGLQIAAGIVLLFADINLMVVVLLLAPLAMLWPLLNGVSWARYKIDMGFHRGKGLWRELGAGLTGYLAGLPIIALGIILTTIIMQLTGATPDHPLQYDIVDGGVFKIILLISAAVIWAPLVEESIFRAAFYRHLRQIRGVPGWLIATVINAFVFAAIHPQGYAGLPALMAIAFVLSGIREWRGSVLPSMFAHAFHNATAIAILGIMLYA